MNKYHHLSIVIFLIVFTVSMLLFFGVYNKKEKGNQILIAVASNFSQIMKAIVVAFEKDTGNEIVLIFGSTGKIYAQIHNKAPFDAFFAADVERPRLLEKQGLAQKNSRFTYAFGKIALWSPRANLNGNEGKDLLKNKFRHLSMANPNLSPYGLASKQILKSIGMWQNISHKIVYGENINQTFGFVKSGNAEIGFVAYSQLKYYKNKTMNSFWLVPQKFYTPIKQQAIQISKNKITTLFLEYIKSEKIKSMIRIFGYATP